MAKGIQQCALGRGINWFYRGCHHLETTGQIVKAYWDSVTANEDSSVSDGSQHPERMGCGLWGYCTCCEGYGVYLKHNGAIFLPQPEHMGLVIKGWEWLVSLLNPRPSCRIFASLPGFLELCVFEDLGPQRRAGHQGHSHMSRAPGEQPWSGRHSARPSRGEKHDWCVCEESRRRKTLTGPCIWKMHSG